MLTEACSHLIDGIVYDTTNAQLIHAAFYDECDKTERFDGMMRHLMCDLSGRYFLFDLVDTHGKRPLWRIYPISASEAKVWCQSSSMSAEELDKFFPTTQRQRPPPESVALLSSQWGTSTEPEQNSRP